MTTLSSMEAIAEPMRPPIRTLADLVRKLAGNHAKSLTLFGAIAAGSFDATRHTVRSVLIVDAVDLSVLRRLAEHGAKLGKAHVSAPLIMTPQYITDSLDTFPLELIEIHQNHITVFGEDHFADLSFDDGHVRLQCERELKVLLIGLRQGLLAAAGREKVLAELEVNMAENLLRTLRGMLWLKGRREAQPATEVIVEVENLVQRKLPGVRAAVDREAAHDWGQFESLYRDVEALGATVDAW